MLTRKRLSDILTNSELESIQSTWETTDAAADLGPLPDGTYTAKLDGAEIFTARTGTHGVKLTLVVVEPAEHAGRRLWSDQWLTLAAMPGTKRDLLKIGISDLAQLERPIPDGIILSVRVALRKDDDGTERNRVTRLDLVRIEPPPPNPFAPPDDEDGGGPEAVPF
jgi:hypothetical protein